LTVPLTLSVLTTMIVGPLKHWQKWPLPPLQYGARFLDENLQLPCAIEFHAFAAPLEVLPCVWPMAFLSGATFLPVYTANYVTTLKGYPSCASMMAGYRDRMTSLLAEDLNTNHPCRPAASPMPSDHAIQAAAGVLFLASAAKDVAKGDIDLDSLLTHGPDALHRRPSLPTVQHVVPPVETYLHTYGILHEHWHIEDWIQTRQSMHYTAPQPLPPASHTTLAVANAWGGQFVLDKVLCATLPPSQATAASITRSTAEYAKQDAALASAAVAAASTNGRKVRGTPVAATAPANNGLGRTSRMGEARVPACRYKLGGSPSQEWLFDAERCGHDLNRVLLTSAVSPEV
jgi:hypothetical protein